MKHFATRTVRPDIIAVLLPKVLPFILWMAVLIFCYSKGLPPEAPLSLIVAGGFALWFFYSLVKFLLNYFGAAYEISADKVTATVGIIARNQSAVHIGDIRGTTYKQTILGRVFGYGEVSVGTAAHGGNEITMRDIRNPAEVVAIIDSLRRGVTP